MSLVGNACTSANEGAEAGLQLEHNGIWYEFIYIPSRRVVCPLETLSLISVFPVTILFSKVKVQKTFPYAQIRIHRYHSDTYLKKVPARPQMIALIIPLPTSAQKDYKTPEKRQVIFIPTPNAVKRVVIFKGPLRHLHLYF
ncbi:hypothetical protein EYC80_010088 [Monilinia laxa]|uniref:Uncharacterized protein n=1 Tax=Monilinia laxa TaxID=61186 RepID=A0A5N6JUI3_MONLA|nr:hypothetical protein EYC80_010088 [Monilinia laxa]